MRFDCDLHIPDQPAGAVVFAHGSGVDRHDERARHIARELRAAGLATALVDLLDERECREPHNVFDVELQAARLLELTRWLDAERGTGGLPIGYFGTGVGAGVALSAAAMLPERVRAVVSAGGRPDTALFSLPKVRAATLFISHEPADSLPWYIDSAYQRVASEKSLVAVPSAGRCFDEPGAIAAVAAQARRWFGRHLSGSTLPDRATAR